MIEYIFGHITHDNHEIEILKTIATTHTDLQGFCQIVRDYPDQTITDSFLVINHYHSAEDIEGKCYDWYEIDKHYRIQDKTGPIRDNLTTIQDAICEQDTSISTYFANIENALCELDKEGKL